MHKIGIVVLGITLSLLIIFANRESKRPTYIFINETENHKHDLALKLSLKLAEKKAGIENALILLKSLPENLTIEQAAVELFEHWRIGQDRHGKGILYLYSEKENQFKIEISYSLEGVFPDVICHRLEQAAQSYMLSEISQDFLSELLITMNFHGQNQSETWDLGSVTPKLFGSGGGGVREKGYRPILSDYLSAIRSLSEEEDSQFKPSTNPQETVSRYLTSLQKGIGDAQLPLLTEGSRVFRMVVPRSEYQQRRVMNYYRRAQPFQLLIKEPLGLVVFQPGVANLPIVLRHARDGRWYVDEPKAWTYFHRWEDGIDFVPKYSDLPILDELKKTNHPNAQKPIYSNRVVTPEVISYPFSLEAEVRRRKEAIKKDPENSEGYARLGEVYLFEMNWLSKSIEMFERASQLAPDRLDYRWRLWDLYINNSEVEKALTELKFLAAKLPGDEELKKWLAFYTKAYQFEPGEF